MRWHLHYSEPHLKAAFPKAGVISARQDKTRQDRNHFVWDTILAAGESTQVVYQAPHQGPNEIHGSHTKQASQKSLFNREVHNSKKLRIIIRTEHFRTLQNTSTFRVPKRSSRNVLTRSTRWSLGIQNVTLSAVASMASVVWHNLCHNLCHSIHHDSPRSDWFRIKLEVGAQNAEASEFCSWFTFELEAFAELSNRPTEIHWPSKA